MARDVLTKQRLLLSTEERMVWLQLLSAVHQRQCQYKRVSPTKQQSRLHGNNGGEITWGKRVSYSANRVN